MGRPRKHLPGEEPQAKERLMRSKEKLIAAGGKMLNVRLTPEGNEALKKLLNTEEFSTETEAVNRVLIDRSKK